MAPRIQPAQRQYGCRDAKYGCRDAKYGYRDAKYGCRDAKFCVSTAHYKKGTLFVDLCLCVKDSAGFRGCNKILKKSGRDKAWLVSTNPILLSGIG